MNASSMNAKGAASILSIYSATVFSAFDERMHCEGESSALIAHQRRFAEQAFDQIHRQLPGAIVFIEGRIELDDVQRAE